MRTTTENRTLQLSRPYDTVLYQGAVLALILTVLISGLFEIGSQIPLVQQLLPPPALATANPQFDIKIDRLDQWVRANGTIDCIFMGSSQVDGGIDPAVVSQSYHNITGQTLDCFNFGLSTLTSQTAGPLAHLLIERYQPKLLIFGTSPRDFSEQFGDLSRSLSGSAFIRQYNGEPSLQGWLVKDITAYRYYLGFQQWQDPENRVIVWGYEGSIQPNGFDPKDGSYQFTPNTQEILIADFEIHEPDWIGFQELSRIDQSGTRVIVLEMPVHSVFLPYYLGSLIGYEVRFMQPVEAFLKHYKIPFWHTQDDATVLLRDSMWKDQRHLNSSGARVFSSHLGKILAQRIPSLISGEP